MNVGKGDVRQLKPPPVAGLVNILIKTLRFIYDNNRGMEMVFLVSLKNQFGKRVNKLKELPIISSKFDSYA